MWKFQFNQRNGLRASLNLSSHHNVFSGWQAELYLGPHPPPTIHKSPVQRRGRRGTHVTQRACCRLSVGQVLGVGLWLLVDRFLSSPAPSSCLACSSSWLWPCYSFGSQGTLPFWSLSTGTSEPPSPRPSCLAVNHLLSPSGRILVSCVALHLVWAWRLLCTHSE